MRYEFAGYRFDPEMGLSLGARPIRLAPKECRLLAVLLQAQGRTLSKEDLGALVWGDVAVSDSSIFRAVYKLRQAMAAAGGPDVVETLYGTGFRMAASIRLAAETRSPTVGDLVRTPHSAAANALLSAREYGGRRTPEDFEIAARAAQRALDLDPRYVAAWTMIAEVRCMQVARSLRQPRDAAHLAFVAIDEALACDPHCAAALALRGWMRGTVNLDVADGLADVDRALAEDPEHWGTFMVRGWLLQAARRHDESVDAMRRALVLHPTGQGVNAMLALYLALAGRMDEALVMARDLAEQFPTVENAQGVAAAVASMHGLYDEAIAFGRRAYELAPQTPLFHTGLAYALAMAGREDESRALLDRIEATPLPRPSAGTALVRLALGERERAVADLVDAYERGVPQFTWTRDDPRYAALRGEPRVEAVWSEIAASLRPRQLQDVIG